MITTSNIITIEKVLRMGPVTTYTPEMLSLFITNNGVQKRYTASSVVNSSATSSGLVTFTDVPLAVDGNYSLYITGESDVDLDTSGVSLDKLATGFVKKITNISTMRV